MWTNACYTRGREKRIRRARDARRRVGDNRPRRRAGRTVRPLRISRHAASRCQQRAIPESLVELIVEYGVAEHDGRGCTRFLMTEACVERVACSQAEAIEFDGLRGCYVVVAADGTIVTVGHRQ